MSSPEVRSNFFDIGSQAKPDDLSLANKCGHSPLGRHEEALFQGKIQNWTIKNDCSTTGHPCRSIKNFPYR